MYEKRAKELFKDQPCVKTEFAVFAYMVYLQIQDCDDLIALDKTRRYFNSLIKKHPKNCGYYTAAIQLIKKRIASSNPELAEPKRKYEHMVSDHALVQYLRRAHGLNIERIKDRVLSQNKHYKLRPVMADGVIVTYLPRLQEAM